MAPKRSAAARTLDLFDTARMHAIVGPTMSKSSLTIDAMLAAAAAKGATVRYPNPDELFLDLDSDEDWIFFGSQFELLADSGLIKDYTAGFSRSGAPHRHIVVRLNRDVRDNEERLMLQAMLGSDRKHELLSFLAIPTNPNPTVFFE